MIAATLLLVTVSAPIIASMFDKPIVVNLLNEKPQIISNIEVLIPKEPEPKVPEAKPVEPSTPVTTVINAVPTIKDAKTLRILICHQPKKN